MSKIIGSITATPNPLSDWNQTDEKKADYIKNKPKLGAIAKKDVISKADLASDITNEINAKAGVSIMIWEAND